MPFHLPRSQVLGPSHYTKWHPSKSCKGSARVPCPSKCERSAAVPRGSILLLVLFYTRVYQDCSTTPCSDTERCTVEWTQSCQNAFEELKSNLTESPLLAYPDFDKSFILETDVSVKGLGAVLSHVGAG